jgi:coenzyme F420 biosynthesis associated uncharacterized protein
VIDWIIAERIAALISGPGNGRVPRVDLGELARLSEERVVQYTGMVPTAPLPPAEGVARTEWVASNISSTRALLDPMLSRAGKRIAPQRRSAQIGISFLLSAEMGLLVGYLGQRILGQYELVLLDEAAGEHPPRLLFVLPNLGEAVAKFDADEREFMTWVTLHEVTHAVQFGSVPWLQPHLAGLVRALLDSAELRIESERRVRFPSRDELARMGRAVRHADLIGLVASEAERGLIDEVQAVMAVIEGHAEHVMDAVAPDLLPSLPRLRKALDARRREQTRLSKLVARVLGLELKLRQYERGKQFCDFVVREAGVGRLGEVFSEPASLPSLAEIDDPARWLARTT